MDTIGEAEVAGMSMTCTYSQSRTRTCFQQAVIQLSFPPDFEQQVSRIDEGSKRTNEAYAYGG